MTEAVDVLGRIDGTTEAVETPIGNVPASGSLNVEGLDVDLTAALHVDEKEWQAEVPRIEEWLATFGERLPTDLQTELAELRSRVNL